MEKWAKTKALYVFAIHRTQSSLSPKHKTDVLPCFPFCPKIKDGFNDFWRYRFAGWHFDNEI